MWNFNREIIISCSFRTGFWARYYLEFKQTIILSYAHKAHNDFVRIGLYIYRLRYHREDSVVQSAAQTKRPPQYINKLLFYASLFNEPVSIRARIRLHYVLSILFWCQSAKRLHLFLSLGSASRLINHADTVRCNDFGCEPNRSINV